MPKCVFRECNGRPAPIIGDCKYCKGKYCSIHRLPESHCCSEMSACKSKSHSILSERLLSEKCVADKL